MNFKNEPGHAQSQLHAWPLINYCGKAWKKGENTLWPGSCLRLSIIWHLRGSHQCSRILTISTVIIYEVQNSSTSLFLPRPNIEYGRECFRYSGVKIWNSIQAQFSYKIPTNRIATLMPTFKNILFQTVKSYMFA
jgi:hypothetical protein